MILSKTKRIELKKTSLFKESNKHWNELNLNHGYVVGYLMNLLNKSNAKTFEEWEAYYLKSGLKRNDKIKSIENTQIRRNLISFNRDIPKKYYKYNTDYGRTIDDLIDIAKKLDKVINVGIELAFNYVYIRVIDETWIGYEREINAFVNLKKYLKNYNLDVKKTPPDIDIIYGVDFEIKDKDKDKLIAGIQLKSTNYLNNKCKLSDIIEITEDKNKCYTQKFKAPVYYIYINTNGLIMNLNDIYFLIIKNRS